jgi:hypothetical protein
MGLGRQIVYLDDIVNIKSIQYTKKSEGIRQVPLYQMEFWVRFEVLDPLMLTLRTVPGQAIYRVVLGQQKLGQVGSVLAGHTGYERGLHT